MTTTLLPHHTLTTEPIHFTSDYAAWKEFYLQLGLAETEANDPLVTILASGAQALAPYGLNPRIASNSGGWTDLIGNGLFAFHQGTLQTVENDAPNQPLIEIFAETGDVEAYKAQLESRGGSVTLIDEAYARTLNITQPDGRIFTVNETQQDLYGFHRLDS